jgi:hypothetical protein
MIYSLMLPAITAYVIYLDHRICQQLQEIIALINQHLALPDPLPSPSLAMMSKPEPRDIMTLTPLKAQPLILQDLNF